jgi:phosphate acyltransferase
MTKKISIDCMGGDHGPRVTVPAALAFLKREPEAELILVGREDAIRAELQRRGALHHARLSIVHTSEVVEMDDPLEVALRRKKDSSMRVAIDSGQRWARTSLCLCRQYRCIDGGVALPTKNNAGC